MPRPLALLALAAPLAACAPGARPPAYARWSGACATVPLRVERGLPIVTAHVAGEPVDLIVDTGSAQSITLRPDDVARLGLAPNGASRAVRDAKGNRLEVRGYAVPEVRLGAVVFHDVAAWEARHAPGWAPPVDAGHIGRGLLSAARLTIDEPRGALHLACPRRAGEAVPLRATADGWTSHVAVGPARLALIWDTAATTSVVRADRAAPLARLSARAGAPIVLVAADLPGLPADGLVGGDLFRAHAVTFDLAAGEAVVE